MKIFILEDNPFRQVWFKKTFFKDELFIFDDVQKAKEFLIENKDIDILFLDHDLDHRIYVDSNEENTGYQLVRFIAQEELTFKLAVIHSLNNYGAMRMHDLLEQYKSVEVLKRIDFLQLKTMTRDFFDAYIYSKSF